MITTIVTISKGDLAKRLITELNISVAGLVVDTSVMVVGIGAVDGIIVGGPLNKPNIKTRISIAAHSAPIIGKTILNICSAVKS